MEKERRCSLYNALTGRKGTIATQRQGSDAAHDFRRGLNSGIFPVTRGDLPQSGKTRPYPRQIDNPSENRPNISKRSFCSILTMRGL